MSELINDNEKWINDKEKTRTKCLFATKEN